MRKSLRKKRKALLRKTARDFLEGKHDYGCCPAIIDSCSVREFGDGEWIQKLIQDFRDTMSPKGYVPMSFFIPIGEEYHERRAMLLLLFAEMQ